MLYQGISKPVLAGTMQSGYAYLEVKEDFEINRAIFKYYKNTQI